MNRKCTKTNTSRTYSHPFLVLCCLFWVRTTSVNGWIQSKESRTRNSQSFLSQGKEPNPSVDEVYEEENTRQEPTICRPFEYSAEVVGASGRLGSFLLCHGCNETVSTTVPVPKGISPGCLSRPGSPIFVATPSGAWSEIWDRTLPERRRDLIFVGNGVPPDYFKEATTVVPHFSVLQICHRNDTSKSSPVGTSRHSPKTVLFGKHASATEVILERFGIPTEVLSSFSQLRGSSVKKLLWASCFWLLCHIDLEDGMDLPLTVGQVHEYRQEKLEVLVDDLLPALEGLISEKVDRVELIAYLRAYSMSIKNATPSLGLAVEELQERNGVFLSRRCRDHPQTYHLDLIRRLVKSETYDKILAAGEKRNEDSAAPDRSSSVKLDVWNDIGLIAWGRPYDNLQKRQEPKNVVVVGGGMLGSSMAYFLSKRQPTWNIVVIDQGPDRSLGKTTAACWAWLNGNGKSPKSYQLLNQLGLHVWKRESTLSSVASWMGSLVRFNDTPSFVNDGGYPVEGPLSNSRILELEPSADWRVYTSAPTGTTEHPRDDDDDSDTTDASKTFYFPDEGYVDPLVAVERLQMAAKKRGVRFITNQNVTRIVRDQSSEEVIGVETAAIVTEDDAKTEHDKQKNIPSENIDADLVIVAAGTGASSPALGGIPMLHRPGQIAFAWPTDDVDNEISDADGTNSPDEPKRRLSRILVDPLRGSHVLQRSDGCIVIGGGSLEFGGTSRDRDKQDIVQMNAQSMIDGATKLSPTVIRAAALSHTAEAVRPMPSDGLPVIGYNEQGVYYLVMHSGMTLGPLTACLAAGEIAENISCDVLAPFRPSRFE